jgi:FTR1 family protein
LYFSENEFIMRIIRITVPLEPAALAGAGPIQGDRTMLATLLVTLREGIEAFLIVAITLAYLRKTHRVALGSAVLWGTGAGVALSVLAGYFFRQAENKPLWEGFLALAAAVMVLSMVFYMRRRRRSRAPARGLACSHSCWS